MKSKRSTESVSRDVIFVAVHRFDGLGELLRTLMDYLAESEEAHVFQLCSHLPYFAISRRTLTPYKARQIFHEREMEIATERMKNGATPQQIRDCSAFISGRDIRRIAKKLGTERQRENSAAGASAA